MLYLCHQGFVLSCIWDWDRNWPCTAKLNAIVYGDTLFYPGGLFQIVFSNARSLGIFRIFDKSYMIAADSSVQENIDDLTPCPCASSPKKPGRKFKMHIITATPTLDANAKCSPRLLPLDNFGQIQINALSTLIPVSQNPTRHRFLQVPHIRCLRYIS
jgi:hypothetical protein